MKKLFTHLQVRDLLNDLRDLISLTGKVIIVYKNLNDWTNLFQRVFSAEQYGHYFLRDKIDFSESTILSEYSLCIIELESDHDEDLIQKIKSSYPSLPIIGYMNDNFNNKIDSLYDFGIDKVILKADIMNNTSQNADLKNIIKLFKDIILLISKGRMLRIFWSITQEMVINCPKKYLNGNLNIIESKYIRTRIEEKLKVAYGHLRKPTSQFDGIFEFTTEDFAFITYWSCFNEIISEWLDLRNNNVIKLKNNFVIAERVERVEDKKEKPIYLSKFKSDKVYLNESSPNSIKELKSNLATWAEYYFKYTIIESNSLGVKFDKNPKFMIPVILYNLGALTEENQFIIHYLNYYRNKLEYIHGDSSRIIKTTVIGNFNREERLTQIFYLLELLYLILNPERKKISSDLKAQFFNFRKYYIKIQKKVNFEGSLRVVGKYYQELTEHSSEKRRVYSILINGEYIPITVLDQKLIEKFNTLKENDTVELSYHLTSFEHKNLLYPRIVADDLILF